MMTKKLFLAAFAVTLLGGQIALSPLAQARPAHTAPCRDAKGRFTSCERPKAAPCRDEKGRFTACKQSAPDRKAQKSAKTPAAPAPENNAQHAH